MTMQPTTFDQLEQSTLAEVRAEAEKVSAEQPGGFKKIASIIGKISDKVTKWGLPEGVDLERYKFITKMYEKMAPLYAKGELRLGRDWARIFPNASKPKQGMLDSLDSKFDVLDFLLKNYLPEGIVGDEERYQQVRRFFIDKLNLLPALD